MDKFVVPPAAHWYKSAMVACAPDNTLVYGSQKEVVILRAKNPGEAPKIEIIHGAHSKHVVSVSLNRKWGEPHSYVTSLGEDNIIKVWDVTTLEKKTSNKYHAAHKEGVIGAVFAGDDRVVSATVHGLVVIWNINTNESKPLKDLFKAKVTLTCLSSCPHAGWLLAFGLNDGAVVVADLRRNGQILYRLRGHYQSIVALAWCPVPVNVFPKNPKNVVKNKSPETVHVEREKEKENKVNPWINLVHADDDEVSHHKDHSLSSQVSDFLQECDDLTKRILGLEESSPEADKGNLSKTHEKERPKDQDGSDSDERERFEEVQNRPLPRVFDPSGDFLDDSGVEDESSLEEKDEDIQVIEISQDKKASTSENEEKDLPEDDEQTGRNTPPGEENKEEKGLKDTEQKEEGSSKDKELSKESENDVSEVKDPVSLEVNVSMADKDVARNETQPSAEDAIAKDEDVQKEESSSKGTGEYESNTSEVKDSVFSAKQDPILEVADKDIAKDETQPCVEEAISKDDAIQNEDNLESRRQDEAAASKPEEIMEEEPRTEYLLASSSRDRSVYIWRAGTDGTMQTSFCACPKGKRYSRRDRNSNTWISLCWITPTTLLTSSPTGEILAWPMPKPKESNKQYSVVHSKHTSFVFNIATPARYFTANDWHQDACSSLSAWSWSQDARLIHYDLNTRQIVHFYNTVTSVVTCFGPSVVDPNRLAVGLRDGGLYVWNLNASNINVMSMQKYQQKFTHKVSSLAWHPNKEMIVGFGTEEGRVGFIDINTKKTVLFPCHFRTQVYQVEWGPLMNDASQDLGLYVLADGKIGIHDINKFNDGPTELEVPDKLKIYRFAWKPSFKFLLLNGRDGSLVVLKNDLTAVNTTLYFSDRGLNEIVWHSDAFSDDCEATPRCHWFAAAVNKGVVVFDCRSIGDENFAEKRVASFEAHVKPPVALAWCPFDGNKLASVALDGLAQVYNVELKSVIATLVNPYCPISVVVAWSPLSEDLVITGDRILRIWSVKENPPQCDKEFLAARKRLVQKSTKGDDKPDKNKIKVEIPDPKTVPKNCIVPAFYVASDANIESQIATMRILMNGDSNLLDKGVNPFLVFADKEDVTHLLDQNYQRQKKEGKPKACELISLWKGNIAEHIEKAISENRVTPSIITLAPMVSTKLWQDACLAYATKLSEDANAEPLETAAYFLACHKVQEAIDYLCANLMFREALALAKQRLPESSKIITSVTEKWAEHCTFTGNFENAAYCYISIKDFENAAKVLSRRNRPEFLEFALELAEKTENKGLVDSIKNKLTEGATVNKEGGGDDAAIDAGSAGSETLPKSVADSGDAASEEGAASIAIAPSRFEAVMIDVTTVSSESPSEDEVKKDLAKGE